QPQPPPSPYGPPAGSASASAATISSSAVQFTVKPGAEVRVGRDPAQCPVFLSEPRVSGVHATLKFEASQLWVRDETSNNGTVVWTAVAAGPSLRFGPMEFNVQLEP